jgi:hypothetical protein
MNIIQIKNIQKILINKLLLENVNSILMKSYMDLFLNV